MNKKCELLRDVVVGDLARRIEAAGKTHADIQVVLVEYDDSLDLGRHCWRLLALFEGDSVGISVGIDKRYLPLSPERILAFTGELREAARDLAEGAPVPGVDAFVDPDGEQEPSAGLASRLAWYMESLRRLDPDAITALTNYRVPCNEALAGHPTVRTRERRGGGVEVGLLGLLNGLALAEDPGEVVLAMYEEPTGNGPVVQFRTFRPVVDDASAQD